MNPKKYKNILDEVYNNLGGDPNLVDDVLDFYWSNVRKCISSVSHPKLNIENLGILQLKNGQLDKTITKYYRLLDKIAPSTFNQYGKYNSVRNRIDILENAQKQMAIEKERRKEIKTNRYEWINRNLEEEGKDS